MFSNSLGRRSFAEPQAHTLRASNMFVFAPLCGCGRHSRAGPCIRNVAEAEAKPPEDNDDADKECLRQRNARPMNDSLAYSSREELEQECRQVTPPRVRGDSMPDDPYHELF